MLCYTTWLLWLKLIGDKPIWERRRQIQILSTVTHNCRIEWEETMLLFECYTHRVCLLYNCLHPVFAMAAVVAICFSRKKNDYKESPLIPSSSFTILLFVFTIFLGRKQGCQAWGTNDHFSTSCCFTTRVSHFVSKRIYILPSKFHCQIREREKTSVSKKKKIYWPFKVDKLPKTLRTFKGLKIPPSNFRRQMLKLKKSFAFMVGKMQRFCFLKGFVHRQMSTVKCQQV